MAERWLRFRLWLIGAAGAVGFVVSLVGGTADADDIVPPVDPVARAAFDVLEKHCARCHQEGRLVSRERPAKNFGNVLKLDAIAADPNLILPGNPYGSKIFREIADQEMPYDINYEGETRYPSVSEADLKALQDWITSLGSKPAVACSDHRTITPSDMVAFMATDLDRLPRGRRIGTRYLTLTHLANICTDPQAMAVYRQAAVKLLNSLSRSSDAIRLETIDPEATIIRFNLTDIGWSATEWDSVLAVYPYNIEASGPTAGTLYATTRSALPYVRADWFAYNAAQPPLYHILLKLPGSFPELAGQQGVDIDNDIRNFVAQRAAFQKSGVSLNNRLIERHPSRSGYFWTSYDFSGNRDRQSLFEYPLGPGAGGFRHDGAETLFSLPNGFQGYALSRGTGERLDKAPTSIVRDVSRKDLTVTNGISCMGCHETGLRKARDEVRNFVIESKSFAPPVREMVEGLYPPHETMDALIAGDAKRFTDAMTRAGLDPALKLNGVEMINALAKRYEDDVDLALAAAEFGLDKQTFLDQVAATDGRFNLMLRRLQQGSVPRDQFELVFRELAAQLSSLRVVAIPSMATPLMLARPLANNELSLTSDADIYNQGDAPVFTIASPRDCYLTLTDVDQKGEGTVLLPNRFQQDNFIRAGIPVQFPGDSAPFKYQMRDSGLETVVAVCSQRSVGTDGIRHDFTRNAFTSVPNYNAALARAIAVVPATPGAPSAAPAQSSALVAPATPADAAQTASASPAGPVAANANVPAPGGPRSSLRAAITLRVR
jgi:Domain of unknown function (DUF4384)